PLELKLGVTTTATLAPRDSHFFDASSNYRSPFKVFSINIIATGTYEIHLFAPGNVGFGNKSMMFPRIFVLDGQKEVLRSERISQVALPPSEESSAASDSKFLIELSQPGKFLIVVSGDMSGDSLIEVPFLSAKGEPDGNTEFSRTPYATFG